MKNAFLSRFTPSLMSHEVLESIFVQRERDAQRTVELIQESVLTESKSNTLFIGPRGIGKTHLVSLIYHRLREMDDLKDHILIAWLREEEWGVSSFLDLLQRILRSLAESDRTLEACIATVQEAKTEAAAELIARNLLRDIVGDRTLLILAENLDDLFDGMRVEGQKRFRSFLQETRFSSILATSQNLFNGVSRQSEPFYNFFRTQHLAGLNLDDALSLLTKIAQLEEDEQLTSFLGTPSGRARVRAVHHLAGGNPRVYVIFSEFLTREALDDLVDPFLKMLDELTPYYQSKMRTLSAQQRKIIEILTDVRGAVQVKEIAQRSYLSNQTVSAQLHELSSKGYVIAHKIGRESFYELQEPLMRLCLEVKKQRGEPIKLFVEFLRLMYSKEELKRRLDANLPISKLTKIHLQEALRVAEKEGNILTTNCLKEYYTFYLQEDYQNALNVSEELIAIRGMATDWLLKGSVLINLKLPKDALKAYDEALSLNPKDPQVWLGRGIALVKLEKREIAAINAFDKVLALTPNNAYAWSAKAIALGLLGRYSEALDCIENSLSHDANNASTWVSKGLALTSFWRFEEALSAFDKALAINSKNAFAWSGRAFVLNCLDRFDEALAAYDVAINLDDTDLRLRVKRIEIYLALEHWAEFLEVLSNLMQLSIGSVPDFSDLTVKIIEWIFGHNQSFWLERITAVIGIYDKYFLLVILGQSLISTIRTQNSPFVTPIARQTWLSTWQQASGDIAEMQLPLRLLDTAIRHYDSGNPPDQRILLELPIEERSILEGILENKQDDVENTVPQR